MERRCFRKCSMKAKPDTLLNKRSELVAKCRHCNKFKLNKFVT